MKDPCSLHEFDAFLSLQAARGWSRVSVATSAQALRSFFDTPKCTPGVQRAWRAALMVDVSSNRKDFPWDQTGRMSSDSSRPLAEIGHVRSAIMPSSCSLPLYAFRSGEVAALRLEDLHRHRELIMAEIPPLKKQCVVYFLDTGANHSSITSHFSQSIISPIAFDAQGADQSPAFLQGIPRRVVTINDVQQPQRCFGRQVS